MKKGLLLALAMVMAFCIGIGGTLAYLFVETNQVVNTFAYGDIEIDLTETVNGTSQSAATNKVENDNFKMVPGNTLTKDPKVTVKANSEACWLFVKVEKSDNFDNFMTCEIADGWTELASVAGANYKVYYREVGAVTVNTEFTVLNDNQVAVKNTVLKTNLKALTESTYPTLTFTAYAVQKANVATVADAWALVETKGVPVTNASN